MASARTVAASAAAAAGLAHVVTYSGYCPVGMGIEAFVDLPLASPGSSGGDSMRFGVVGRRASGATGVSSSVSGASTGSVSWCTCWCCLCADCVVLHTGCGCDAEDSSCKSAMVKVEWSGASGVLGALTGWMAVVG